MPSDLCLTKIGGKNKRRFPYKLLWVYGEKLEYKSNKENSATDII